MIVYQTLSGGRYVPFDSSNGARPLYVNLTNRCDCDCVFCLRNKKDESSMSPENSLWIDREPSVSEVESELEKIPWQFVTELVFCGFGEPTQRLDELVELLKFSKSKHPETPTRLNTNGLAELSHGSEIANRFKKILDTISISLNASNSQKYLKLTRAKYGIKSYAAMLDFAEHAKRFVPNVVLTIVDKVNPPEEIAACRKICDARNLTLRVRTYEDH